MLLKAVQSGRLEPHKLVTHRFALGDIMKAYDTFGDAATQRALKVVLKSAALGGASERNSAMTMSLPALLLLVVIAAVCGAVGKAIAGSARGGLVVSTALGFIGALLGPWVARALKLSEPFMVTSAGIRSRSCGRSSAPPFSSPSFTSSPGGDGDRAAKPPPSRPAIVTGQCPHPPRRKENAMRQQEAAEK